MYSCYYTTLAKKKNHHRDSRREERCSTCDIMLDQARSAQGKSDPRLSATFALRWSRLIEHDITRGTAFFSPRISRMVLFFGQGSMYIRVLHATLRHGIQTSMEAILACHPARSTEWLDCHPKSCELWRIRTGPILLSKAPWWSLNNASGLCVNIVGATVVHWRLQHWPVSKQCCNIEQSPILIDHYQFVTKHLSWNQ